MKQPSHSSYFAGGPRRSRGFSLIELSIAIAISLMVAGSGLALLNQHIAFARIMHSFEFLRTEAPQINSLVNQSTSRASSYRIFRNKQDALNGVRSVNTEGKAIRLIYRNPDSSVVNSVFAFEPVNGVNQLNFYHNEGSGWSTPDWSVTRTASDIVFADDSGILLMTIKGPASEEVTYAATTE